MDKKGENMADWKKYTLEEVCERIYSGGTPSTKHEEYWNGNIKWLSSGETSQRFVYDTDRKITQKGIENSSTKLATKGCTVIATAGQGYTRGQASFLMTDTYMNQSVIACKANEGIILPLYLYYNLDSRYEEFRLLSDGTSTRGGLSGWILKRMEIKLPPISLQEKIVDVLYSIDKKIEENNAINNNLLEQASTLFNSAIQQSTSVVYAELGSLAEVKGGKRLPKGINLVTTPNQHPYIRVRDLNNTVFASLSNDYEYVDDETQQSISRYIVSTGDLLISIVGTIGLTAIVDHTLNKANLTENCVKLTNIKNVTPEYLLLFLRSSQGVEAISKGTVGAVQLKLPIKNIQSIAVPLLCDEELQSLNEKLSTIFSQISANIVEMKQLADIRDTLLSKLMSGELDVSNIDL